MEIGLQRTRPPDGRVGWMHASCAARLSLLQMRSQRRAGAAGSSVSSSGTDPWILSSGGRPFASRSGGCVQILFPAGLGGGASGAAAAHPAASSVSCYAPRQRPRLEPASQAIRPFCEDQTPSVKILSASRS